MNVLMPTQRWPNLYHPGPATAWLSAAPRSLDEYTGDGDWFKILSVVGRTEQSMQPDDEYYWKHQWGTYQAKSVSYFTHSFKYAYQYQPFKYIVALYYTHDHTSRKLPSTIWAHISATCWFAVRNFIKLASFFAQKKFTLPLHSLFSNLSPWNIVKAHNSTLTVRTSKSLIRVPISAFQVL